MEVVESICLRIWLKDMIGVLLWALLMVILESLWKWKLYSLLFQQSVSLEFSYFHFISVFCLYNTCNIRKYVEILYFTNKLFPSLEVIWIGSISRNLSSFDTWYCLFDRCPICTSATTSLHVHSISTLWFQMISVYGL